METQDIIKNLKSKGSEILDIISQIDFIVSFINKDSIPIKDDINLLNEVAKCNLLSKEEFETLAGHLFARDILLEEVMLVVDYNELTHRCHLRLTYNNAEITIELSNPTLVKVCEIYNEENKYSADKYQRFFEFWESNYPKARYLHNPFSSDALLQFVDKHGNATI